MGSMTGKFVFAARHGTAAAHTGERVSTADRSNWIVNRADVSDRHIAATQADGPASHGGVRRHPVHAALFFKQVLEVAKANTVSSVVD